MTCIKTREKINTSKVIFQKEDGILSYADDIWQRNKQKWSHFRWVTFWLQSLFEKYPAWATEKIHELELTEWIV